MTQKSATVCHLVGCCHDTKCHCVSLHCTLQTSACSNSLSMQTEQSTTHCDTQKRKIHRVTYAFRDERAEMWQHLIQAWVRRQTV